MSFRWCRCRCRCRRRRRRRRRRDTIVCDDNACLEIIVDTPIESHRVFKNESIVRHW